MAVGSFSKEALLKMLRTKIKDYTDMDVGDTELLEIINQTQGELFVLMDWEIKKFWYLETASVVLAADEVFGYYIDDSLPSDLWDVVGAEYFYVEDGEDKRKWMKKIGLPGFEHLSTSRLYDDTHGWCMQGGVFYSSFTEVLGADESIALYYIRKPTNVDDGNDMDLPDPYLKALISESAMTAVATSKIKEDEKQAIIQMIALDAKDGREAVGLPLQSFKDDREKTYAMGIPEVPDPGSGGEGGRDVPIQE